MSKYVVEALPVGKLTLGEGPYWDGNSQKLYYVDILSKSIHSYNPNTKEEFKAVIIDAGDDGGVSFVIPIENESNKFVISVGPTLRELEWDGKSNVELSKENLKIITKCKSDESFNDAKCDSKGRVWAGTMGKWEGGKLDVKKGHLYKFDTNGALSMELEGLDLANGLCWSPDNKTFYYIDSMTNRVDAFDYNITSGKISNRRSVYELDVKEDCIPDGMSIDKDGNLLVANFGTGNILHINPHTGTLIKRIELPTLNVTCMTFGGPNLDILFVTTALFQLKTPPAEVQPFDGCVFQITNLGINGISSGTKYRRSL